MKILRRNQENKKRVAFDDELDMLMKSEPGRHQVRNCIEQMRSENSMIALLESTLHLPGDVMECGVFRGISLRQIALTIADYGCQKRLYGLDSFEGFPKEKVLWRDMALFRFPSRVRQKFKMCNDTPSRLENFFSCFGISGYTVKGYFHDTLPQFANHQFCFLHLDCDLYESHRECLNFLYDRLVPGGAIVFDDYRAPNWPGAERAIDEFFSERPESVERCFDRKRPSWFVRKSGNSQVAKAA